MFLFIWDLGGRPPQRSQKRANKITNYTAPHSLDMVHTCSPKTREWDRKIQNSRSFSASKWEASLGYMRLSQKLKVSKQNLGSKTREQHRTFSKLRQERERGRWNGTTEALEHPREEGNERVCTDRALAWEGENTASHRNRPPRLSHSIIKLNGIKLKKAMRQSSIIPPLPNSPRCPFAN